MSRLPVADGDEESEKAKTDRQMTELLGELRVVLPGAQVLLAFLFTVPFATHFDQVGRGGRIVFFVCLVLTSLATVLRAWNTRIEGSKGEPTSRRRDHVEDR